MSRRIALVQGHPDPDAARFCRGLARAYRAGAESAGHAVREIDVARLEFPMLRSAAAFTGPVTAPDIATAQEDVAWAEHLAIFHPLWMGSMPALLKGFLEQTLRPDFAFGDPSAGTGGRRLRGRSARIVITIGMPALVYRWYFGAAGLRVLERSILGFCGIRPVRATLVGRVETCGAAARERWLARMRRLGCEAR